MYIGIDIGGSSTRIAVSLSIDDPQPYNKHIFPTHNEFESNYQIIKEYIKKIQQPIKGIGLGIAGSVTKDKSMLMRTFNVPQFLNKPLVRDLSQDFHCNVYLENDGIASCFAEGLYTAHRQKDFAYITWGTGIAVISMKHLNKIPQVIKLDRNIYYHHWEEDFGGKGLEKKFHNKAENLSDIEWMETFNLLDRKLTTFLQQYKTDLVVFGGGIAQKKWQQIWGSLKNLSKKTGVTFDLTSLGGDNAGLYGAFALIKQANMSIF